MAKKSVKVVKKKTENLKKKLLSMGAKLRKKRPWYKRITHRS